MSRILELYNSNIYIRLCNELITRLTDVSNFLVKIRCSKNFQDRKQLIELYSNIFDQQFFEGFLQYEVQKVINPHYLQRSNVESELTIGNSSYHILLKINDSDLFHLDKVYDQMLTGLLRAFKVNFSIVDAPEYEITESYLLKRESLINSVIQKTSFFFDSINRRNDIDKRDKLNAEVIYNIPYGGFFHLTHIKNLQSIINNGILSRNELNHTAHPIQDISNTEIQKKRERQELIYGRMLHDYVPLYINPINPFLNSYKVRNSIRDLALIEVYPHILVQLQNTLFSDGNAAEIETNFFGRKDDLVHLDWKLLQKGEWDESESKRVMCSEILIPDFVHRTYIQKIYINNHEILDDVMCTHLNAGGIELIVNTNFFNLDYEFN